MSSNPNHNWIPYYHDQSNNASNYFNQIQLQAPLSTAATATTTTTVSTTTTPRTNNPLSPNQGRVSRPIRRRTRTSRRTPTTLLNTDTSNFRAMVQHYTGGPAATATTYAPIPQLPVVGPLNLLAPPMDAMMDPATRIHAEYANQMQQRMALIESDRIGMGRGGPFVGSSSTGNEDWDFESYMG